MLAQAELEIQLFLKDNTKADLLDKKVQVRENITKTIRYKYQYVQ